MDRIPPRSRCPPTRSRHRRSKSSIRHFERKELPSSFAERRRVQIRCGLALSRRPRIDRQNPRSSRPSARLIGRELTVGRPVVQPFVLERLEDGLVISDVDRVLPEQVVRPSAGETRGGESQPTPIRRPHRVPVPSRIESESRRHVPGKVHNPDVVVRPSRSSRRLGFHRARGEVVVNRLRSPTTPSGRPVRSNQVNSVGVHDGSRQVPPCQSKTRNRTPERRQRLRHQQRCPPPGPAHQLESTSCRPQAAQPACHPVEEEVATTSRVGRNVNDSRAGVDRELQNLESHLSPQRGRPFFDLAGRPRKKMPTIPKERRQHVKEVVA